MDVDQRRSLGFAIGRTSHQLRARTNAALKDAGLTVSSEELAVLQVLTQEARPLRVGDLANLLLRDATTVKRQLDGLVGLGYVTRSQDAQDRRAVLMEATQQGARCVRDLQPVLTAMWESAMSGISTEAAEIALQTLQRMRENLMVVDRSPV